jgi:hypothetical protein
VYITLFVSQQLQTWGWWWCADDDYDDDNNNGNNDMSKAQVFKCLLHFHQQPCHSSAVDDSNPVGCYVMLIGK